MRLGEGVEWGLHSCLALAWLDADAPISAARLAEIHDLPPAYLTKQMQALARAGIVNSSSGPRGGFRLARSPAQVTLLDVVDAIEGGRSTIFECTEIRRQGAGAEAPESCFAMPCSIARAMGEAEDQWRAALAATSLADIIGQVDSAAPGSDEATRVWLAARRR